jgi:hypothetical protein
MANKKVLSFLHIALNNKICCLYMLRIKAKIIKQRCFKLQWGRVVQNFSLVLVIIDTILYIENLM